MICMRTVFLKDEEPAPSDVRAKVNDNTPMAVGTTVLVLERGMASGDPSIMQVISLGNGDTIISETSVRLFLQTAELIKARYPEALER